MSVQDRNVHRDAIIARKVLTAFVLNPAGTDEDEIQSIYQPRFNFRLTDLHGSAEAVATTDALVRACIAKELSAVGAPQFGAAAATTFTIEAFSQLDAGVFVSVGATAAQAFAAAFTVLDGFWGSVTVQIDGAQAITTKAAAGTMAFVTEEDAIKNAPKPDANNGLVAVLTIEASGANFVGGTDNTNTANSFNTIDRGGHVLTLPVATLPNHARTTPATRLRVAGIGNLIGLEDDFLVVTKRSAGVSTITGGHAFAEFRKFPLQGDSGPDVATGLTTPAVP